MANKKNKTESQYFFYYQWPLCPNPKYPTSERPDHPYFGKTFRAQLLMWAVETNSMRVRLYDLDGNLVSGNVDAPADQWVEELRKMTEPQ